MTYNQVLSSFTNKTRGIGGILLATLDYVVKNNMRLTKGPAQEIYDGYVPMNPSGLVCGMLYL